MQQDQLIIGGKAFTSRFFLGTGKFSLPMTAEVIKAAGAEIVTLALRRANMAFEGNILDFIPDTVTLLPNTSGARNAQEAVRIAHLMPDNYETIKATEILAKEGFTVLPYISPDLIAARELVNVGAAAVMPLAAPIGSNKGLISKDFIKMLIDEIDLPIVVDAGIGAPSHACEAMELGADAVLANTAVATAGDVVAMARAFRMAVDAGRQAYLAGLGRVLDFTGDASSPLTGFMED